MNYELTISVFSKISAKDKLFMVENSSKVNTYSLGYLVSRRENPINDLIANSILCWVLFEGILLQKVNRDI